MLLTQATFCVLIIIGNIVAASAPECGPRDVVAARRTCTRACLHDGTCRKKNRECVCDGLCGPSCLRKRCPILSAPLNGNMIVNPIARTIGAEVSYSCNDGYIISGQTSRICQANKTWSGTEPMCTDSTTKGPRQECAERDEVAAGRNCGKTCQPDGTCKKENRECVCDGLCGLTCLKKISCPVLDLEDGALAYLDENNRRVFEPHHGDIRVAVCKDGSSLLGTSQTRCISGSWQDELPSCEVGLCNINDLPSGDWNIVYDYPEGRDASTEVMKPAGTVARFTCNEFGYVAVGQNTRTCRQGEWDGQNPSCERSRCQTSQLEDGRLHYYDSNGTLTLIPRHGDYRIATCNEGYSLEGTSRTQCLEGEWIEELPTCQERQCSIPSCPSHGQWTIYDGGRDSNCRSNRMVELGFRLTYRCDSGYFKCQQMEPVCNDGVWEPNTQNLCVPLGCRIVTLSEPRLTASYTYGGTNKCSHPTYHQQETVIEYSCHRGYKIRDGDLSQATCHGRSWSPQQQPICVEVTCPYISFPHGSVTYQQNGPFTSNRGHTATAHFRCIEGYTLEGHTLSCDNGIWNDTIPTCEEEPCYVAFLERYNMDVLYEVPPGSKEITVGRKTAGTTANFICRQYGFEASQTKRCERGRWRGADPVCVRIPCDHEPLDNGVVTYTLDGVDYQEPVHGMMRNFYCDTGYTVDDDKPSQCDAGSWTRALPVCNEGL